MTIYYRLYFWFAGVSPDRIGGPWWHRDFKTEGARVDFLLVAQPFLCKYAMETGATLEPRMHPACETVIIEGTGGS